MKRDRNASSADLVVIGGGVYGLMIALEACRKGFRTIVLERGNVGGETSANWFRILHGGLRYLQALDLGRTRESVLERRWFLRTIPDLIRPLRFLMPLYGRGLRTPLVFRAAFAVDAALTMDRNSGIGPAWRLPRGRVIDAAETAALFPDVRRDGLKGGALWWEAVAPDGAALIARIRTMAEEVGAVIQENAEAEALLVERGAVAGVQGTQVGAGPQTWRATRVVNAAGPWSAALAERFDKLVPGLFRPSLAFNLLLDRPPLSQVGLALASPRRNAPTLFLYPHQGRTFAGTWHLPRRQADLAATPTETEIEDFLANLADAAPTLGARRSDVVAVFPGLVPAKAGGSAEPAIRQVIHDHGANGGPRGLYSVSGVKFTTARHLALELLGRMHAAG